MEFISRVSTHAGQNRELCLSTHGHLPGTLQYCYMYGAHTRAMLIIKIIPHQYSNIRYACIHVHAQLHVHVHVVTLNGYYIFVLHFENLHLLLKQFVLIAEKETVLRTLQVDIHTTLP